MEGMDVDDVLANFSFLNIHVTNENTQLVPREALVADVHSKTVGHERPFPFLSLPWLAKWRVYSYLSSRDCLGLSRTCRHMYKFNTFAYTHLQFLPPNTLYSLTHSICQLTKVLACSPHYAEAMRTMRIVGYSPSDVPDGCDHEVFYKTLDEGVMALLEHGRHIYSLTLDLNLTGAINFFPKTFTKLLQLPTIRHLRLATFMPPSYFPESILPPEIQEPPAHERLCLSVCSGSWVPMVVRNPRKLRWFALSMFDKNLEAGNEVWARTLHQVAEAATELETLVLNGRNYLFADVLGQILQSGFDRGVLGKLRSLSVNTSTLSLLSLRQLFSGFSQSAVTHLRIVVNHNGRWLHDFGPQYIFELSELVPNLEEISLDQVGMAKASPLPGHLGTWGEAFRMFKKLRRIAFASMFVLDLLCSQTAIDDEDDDEAYEEAETSGSENPGMDVDDGDDEGDEIKDEKDGDDSLVPNLVQLGVWADMFLDEHLRMLAPFAEIWFLDSRFGGQTATGYDQRVMEGEDGRMEFMIYCRHKRKRNGWWWGEHDPVPLD